MRKERLILLLTLCLALCGCSMSQEVEHQAYVLVMGIDTTAHGEIELTIRVPRIGKSGGGDGEGQEGASPYLTFSAQGGSIAEALESLQLLTPRELNLSHIKLMVASDALAGETRFKGIVNQIAETPHLYTNARFAVCEGRAKEFVAAQKTTIGTRLSAEIDAMMEHHAAQGSIPDGSFADLYYASNSFYSDPVSARAWIDYGMQNEAKSAGLVVGNPFRQGSTATGPSSQVYSGAAIFREGVLAGRLNAEETLLMNLARGKVRSLIYFHEGTAYTFALEGRPVRRVQIAEAATRIGLEISLSSIDRIEPDLRNDIKAELENSLRALIKKCLSSGLDPFGFADCAAGGFATIPEWLAFDWRERFTTAGLDVSVRLSSSGGR